MKAILAEVVGVIGGSHASERESQVPLVWFLRRPSPVARRPLPVSCCPFPVSGFLVPGDWCQFPFSRFPLPATPRQPEGGDRGAAHVVLARGRLRLQARPR